MKSIALLIVLMLSITSFNFAFGEDYTSHDKMKEGDWALYKISNRQGTMYQTIIFKELKDGVITAKAITRLHNLDFAPLGTGHELKIQATSAPVITPGAGRFLRGILDLSNEMVKKGEPVEIEVSGKKLTCEVYSGRDETRLRVKNYYSKQAPFNGLVKTGKSTSSYFELLAFGGKDDKIPGGNQYPKNQVYSPDANFLQFKEGEGAAYSKMCDEMLSKPIMEAYKKFYQFDGKKLVNFDEMMKEVEKVNMICVGENHNSVASHTLQLDVIKYLHKKGYEVCIGLEMFYVTPEIQKVMDDYVAGKIDEYEFKTKAYIPCWSENWYKYYRDIFVYARENKIKLLGINCPKDLKKTFAEDPNLLSPEQRKYFADEVDYSNAQHKKITMWNFRGMMASGMGPGIVEKMYPGQCIWDDTMGHHSVEYIVKNPKVKFVSLIGAMHFAYRMTLPERAVKKAKKKGFDLTYKVLFPHKMEKMQEMKFYELMRTDLADYIYFVPPSQDD